MIWFSSDWHLGHRNILQYDARPFKTIEEHDKSIIANYLSHVKEEDTFYFLGDFGLGNIDYFEHILRSLPGNKRFIKGNHDHSDMVKVFKRCGDYLGRMEELMISDVLVTLCHYPLLTWNKSHKGSISIHGHEHGGIRDLTKGKKQIDVAVNMFNYCPVSWNWITQYMDKQSPTRAGHHTYKQND